MPLEVGNEWNYTVRSGLDTFVEPVKVVRQVSCAGVRGYELSGPLGVSRLAWRNNVLFAESMANARFRLPLPLVSVGKPMPSWHGLIESAGKTQRADATLVQKSDTIEIAGRKIKATLSIIEIKTPKATIELKTWFQPGVGIVQQEQRTGSQLDVGIKLLNLL